MTEAVEGDAAMTAEEIASRMTTHARKVWAQCAGIDRTAYIKDRRIYDLVYYRRRLWSVRRELEHWELIDAAGVFTPLGQAVAIACAAHEGIPSTTSRASSERDHAIEPGRKLGPSEIGDD